MQKNYPAARRRPQLCFDRIVFCIGLIALSSLGLCVQGCSNGGAYSDAEVTRMKAESAGVKDPSKLPPDIKQQMEQANARLRVNIHTPPPPPIKAQK